MMSTNKQFSFKGGGAITSLNTRKEGPEEEKVLAIDVKFLVEVDIADVLVLDPSLMDFLYFSNGAVRNTMLGPITFLYEIENYRLDIAGSSHYSVRVKKISLEPKDIWRAKLAFQVSFKPSGDEVATIAECLQDYIEFELAPENMELGFTD
jgi:hypothetical protein